MSIYSNNCSSEPAPECGYVEVGILRLSYLKWGAVGPPLILLHGITSSARTWWRVAPELAGCGYQVYGFDMPGHGESDTIDTHAIADIAALIAQAARSLQLERPALIGHSWGGATVLALGSLVSPAWVVLVDPLLALTSTAGASRLAFYLNGVGAPRDGMLPQILANNPDWHVCDGFWKAEALELCRPAAVRGLFTGSGDWNLVDQIAQNDSPLLLMVADPQHTVIDSTTLASAQSALRLGLGKSVIIPGTTHNMFRGSGFEPFMRVLLSWLKR